MSLRQSSHKIAAVVIAAAALFGVARDGRAQLWRSNAQKMFSFDILQVHEQPFSADSLRLDVYTAVPYAAISFLFASEKYVADYGVVVQVTDQTAARMVQDRYQTYTVLETLTAHETRENKGLDRADARQMSLRLAQNRDYEIRIAVRDLSSKHEADTVIRLTTRSLATRLPALSDLMLFRSRHGTHITPAIGGDVASITAEESGMFAELYNPPAGATLGIVSIVTSAASEREELVRTQSPYQVPSLPDSGIANPRQYLFQNIDFSDLWLGKYILKTYVFASVKDTAIHDVDEMERRSIAHVSRSIHVSSEQGVPLLAGDIEEAISQLSMIATGGEWDSLKNASTMKEKRAAIMQFWRNRNPDRGSRGNRQLSVFYRRLQYANEHFGGTGKGWRSDRGRVYILLGSPTFIDRHPFDVNSKPYEIWEYNDLQTRYYFVDSFGVGDYRLSGSAPPSGYFLWERQSY